MTPGQSLRTKDRKRYINLRPAHPARAPRTSIHERGGPSLFSFTNLSNSIFLLYVGVDVELLLWRRPVETDTCTLRAAVTSGLLRSFPGVYLFPYLFIYPFIYNVD